MTPKIIKLIAAFIGLLVLTIASLFLFEIHTVKGNEVGVKETWSGGVEKDILTPKTYFLTPGWSQEIINYDASSQLYKQPDYRVQSAEGQDLMIDYNVRWRLDTSKVVELHKTVRQDIAGKLLAPTAMRIIKDVGTTYKAIDAYSGEGLVKLQTQIQTRLHDDDELKGRGIIIENFVIVHISLDPKYIEEIKGRQIATQRQLRAVEEQKAAEAEALVAKSKAQADLNKAVVEAQRDKEVMVLAAEADNEKQILAAKAQKEKFILEADGKKTAAISEAEGILALGKAKAEAQKLQLQAYAVEGADAFTRIEIAKAASESFKGITGYLPSDMKVNVLTEGFIKSLDIFSGKNTFVGQVGAKALPTK